MHCWRNDQGVLHATAVTRDGTDTEQESANTHTHTDSYTFVPSSLKWAYGVVLKGLLTLLGSLYKEVAKTTPGALVYRF